MTAEIFNIRDYRRKEEKPALTLEQMEAEIASQLFGTPAQFVIDDYCAPAKDPA